MRTDVVVRGNDRIVVRSDAEGIGIPYPPPCEQVIVTGCTSVWHSAAIRIGWRSSDVVFRRKAEFNKKSAGLINEPG